MIDTQRPLSVRSAVATIRQGVEDLEAVMPSVGPGRAYLLNYWLGHLRGDLKTLELLAQSADNVGPTG